MTNWETYAKDLLNRLDVALKMVESATQEDTERGELAVPDKFSRGYALGYVHALSGAYDALPDWARDGANL